MDHPGDDGQNAGKRHGTGSSATPISRHFPDVQSPMCPGLGMVGSPVLVQIDRKTRLANMAVRRCLLYRAASTAFQTAGALRSLTHSLPMLNCPLWIRRNSSMPAIVIAAVLNHLNPSIGSMRSFTPR